MTGNGSGRGGTVDGPEIAILMATWNGAAHLAEQLQSIARQTWHNWSLWVSDDGSTDGTRAIVESFARHNPVRTVRIVEGPRQGATANFLSLLKRADLPSVHVAFSDQDDVWLPGKLERAMECLSAVPAGRPGLYACRVMRMEADGRLLGPSPVWHRGPSFANALVQNIIGGHATVMNPEAVALVRRASQFAEVPAHDWWVYLVVSGCGGTVIADPVPLLNYRQHEGNLMGANSRLRARLRRLDWIRQGEFARWIDGNLAALEHLSGVLTPEARRLVAEFAALRRAWGPGAARRLWASGIHRQSRAETLLLYWAAAAGRL